MEDGDIPPHWQPTATLTRRNRHRSSSPILNSSLLIILLPSIALLFTVFIIIPSIHKILPITNSTNTQNQKAISVKKSWDFLNITLVLFAILCSIFAKRNDDSSVATTERDEKVQQHPTQTSSTGSSSTSTTGSLRRSKTMMHNYNQSSSSVPQWFEYSQQQRITTSPTNTPQPGTGTSRLRRTVSSDPYMKYNNNNTINHNTGNSQFRFFDDLDISRFYPKDEEYKPPETTTPPVELEKTPVKDIEVDTSEQQNSGKLQSPTFSPPQNPPRNPPAPSPPPPPPPPPAKQRRKFQTIPRREQVPPSPPPPPPPPPLPRGREEKRRSSRKRMNATKEIATAIVHLYSERKRKRRQRSQKSSRNFEDSSENRSQFFPPPSPPPSPPPLPPHPSSALKSWFKKGSKTKKIHSFSSIPKPPPPPTRQKLVNSAGKPPLPVTRETRIPYKARREIDGRDEAMSEINGEDGERASSVTCPSPDLNVKADSFIARHHDGWRLEKLNSWREKLNKAGNGPTF
ncbi:serine/arginine repetitive matrix protein 1-like [Chenopodium quinoa]|uniref:serine/arginine repetitive matrix protein 1-like n=1 Tax=Chenopodium quinoa TaxID=63459 RepID=UPI000B794235|nr:serine/arginine repetitive matrix protein 1-like [Chenopodium quinoa]